MPKLDIAIGKLQVEQVQKHKTHMWIAKKIDWDQSHTDLSKYFIEKIKQKVDYEETISNRHRTTNGYTLISEIATVATLAQKRIKSVNRLISLVNEAKSEQINSSISNDYILQIYHPDIITYYKNFNTNKLKENGKELSELLNKSKINAIRLSEDYYLNIKFELNKINFSEDHFERNSLVIDKLIDCLIPLLLHQGYSTTSISDIAYRFVKKKNGHSSALRIVNNFNGKVNPYFFLIKTKRDREEFKAIENYLKLRKTDFKKVKESDIKQHLFDNFNIELDEELYMITHSTLDPHNYLRNIYEIGLKNYVASKDRTSLQYFTNFFDCVFWRFNQTGHKFQRSNMSIDPINVPKRKSTLMTTIETLSETLQLNFNKDDGIPIINDINDSLYYYNLALGSKSIENSLSLLWTSLETLLPYRLKENDIENVQYFVSKSLSLGAIGREVTSFASRFLNTNWLNSSPFQDMGLYTSYLNYTPDGIKKWIEWLSIEYTTEDPTDPFSIIKENSNLLCKQFCFLNSVYTGIHSDHINAEYWLDKIKASEQSIIYQLDRIYLHRNQIVHSGKFINEYSNLWNHLEWYVGKLLSFCVINYTQRDDKENFNKEELFMNLEADCDLLTNLLENNKHKKIKEIFYSYNLVCKHTWQFF